MIRSIKERNLIDELETLSSAYNDLKREHSIVKQSLETHRDWLKSSDEEVVRLTKENKALHKQNAKLERKMNKTGVKSLKQYKDFVKEYEEEVRNDG